MIFLPLLSDIFIPDTENTKIYQDQRKLDSEFTRNISEKKEVEQEYALIDMLEANKSITA